ncbi:MAG TPA: SCO family protein [Mucilaginibacter sp.]|nr:SCO family protein [Mucilaginibacter sp.]
MKTHIILLGIATALLASCHRQVAIKSLPCCAKDAAASVAGASDGTQGGNSIYQLPGMWTDQHEKQLSLSNLKGRPQIVAMIFTHCTSVCPRIVEQMKAIRDSLPASVRNNVGGVLVSFDPQRDTPAQLRVFAAQRQLDDRWELLKGNDDQVRELSMALNVKYQKLAGGEFSHTGNIYILDKEGNIAGSVDGLSSSVHNADALLVSLVRK